MTLFVAVFAGLAADQASAATVTHGRYDCVLGLQGACSGDGPDSICLGEVMIRGRPREFLKLDLDRNLAELNGIHGFIHPGGDERALNISWELSLLNFWTLAVHEEDGRTTAHVRSQDSTAAFSCRRLGPND